MSAIFYIMGKSATGKDTVYSRIKQDFPELRPIVLYTTRPRREGEREGVEYHFIDEDALKDFDRQGKIIEQRTYQTVHGPWHYATIDDGTIDLQSGDHYYVAIGTLEAYVKTREYFGEEALIPIYLYVDDETRLMRAINRESRQEEPNFKEVCRRFLADEEDFSEEMLLAAGIKEDPGPAGDEMTAAEDAGSKYGGRFFLENMESGYPPVAKCIELIIQGQRIGRQIKFPFKT